ncbi:hypothetical protein [Streptomyces sp. NPDC094049]|uniref:hypothetical protein n=1 Tax=Streptomyces sp. NPDC094049 TaxID=3154987 RepID=UPI0033219F2B
MAVVEVPGPEPDWERAPQYQGGNRNPAFQASTWEYAAGSFQVVAGLSPSLEALAARLRLNIERTWEDMGEVDVAMFSILKIDFALSRFEASSLPDVFVRVSRAHSDVEGALDVLLAALGIGREAITFRVGGESGFVDLRNDDPEP